MGNLSVPGRSSAQFSWLERGTLNAAGSSPVAPAIGSCGDDTVRSKCFDIAHGRLAKEAAVLSVELAHALDRESAAKPTFRIFGMRNEEF